MFNAECEIVVEKAAELLTKLYMNLVPEIELKIASIRQNYLNSCVSKL